MRTIACAILITLAGCASGKREIGERAQRVGALALSSETRANHIAELADRVPVPVEEIKAEASAIAGEQREVRQHAAGVQDALHRVEDKPGFFGRLAYLAKLGLWSVILGVLLIVLWQIGALPFLRRVFAMAGIVPQGVSSAAKIAAEMFDGNDTTKGADKLVTAMRASDPVMNTAFKRAKKRIAREKANRGG